MNICDKLCLSLDFQQPAVGQPGPLGELVAKTAEEGRDIVHAAALATNASVREGLEKMSPVTHRSVVGCDLSLQDYSQKHYAMLFKDNFQQNIKLI